MLLRSDNLQTLSARDVRVLVEQESLEVVLDLRTEVEVSLEGPGPLTREDAVPGMAPRAGVDGADLELLRRRLDGAGASARSR